MRHKEYLAAVTKIDDAYEEHVLASQRGIFHRDHFDCTRADLVLVNLLDAERVSIGTTMEIAWAYHAKVPIVLAMQDGNLHDHAMIREAAAFRVADLEDACITAASILNAR